MATGLREQRKIRTRRALVSSALRLFAERGYEATLINDIASAAEVSPATFFNYFPDKEAVVFPDGPDIAGALALSLENRADGEGPEAVLLRTVETALASPRLAVGPEGDLAGVRARLLATVPTLRARALSEAARIQARWCEDLAAAFPAELNSFDADVLTGAMMGAVLAAAGRSLRSGTDDRPLPELAREAASAALDRLNGVFELARLGGVPVLGHDRHDLGVDPFAFPAQCLAFGALVDEAGLLVDATGTRIEGVDLQLDAVDVRVLKGVGQQESRGLGAVAAPECLGPGKADPEIAGQVLRFELVEHDFAEEVAGLAADDRQVQLVVGFRTRAVVLLCSFEDAWPDRTVGAGQPADLWIKQQLHQPRSVVAGDRPQVNTLAGQGGSVGEGESLGSHVADLIDPNSRPQRL